MPGDRMKVGEEPLGSRYMLEEKIGEGAMGVVWRGRDRESGAVYAIKVLRPALLADPAVVGRFLRERAALIAVQHPNTVAVHDMVVEGDRLALVMDFVTGEDLWAYRVRRDRTLPPAEAAWLVAQICDALAATHAAGVIHRDLKPANVLLDSTRPHAPVRLADFGIARILDETPVTSSEAIVGTPSYLAPEVLAGRPPGPAGDVYAAGITLYELIVGTVPFSGGPPAAVFQQHLHAHPRHDAKIPDALWQVITQCLAKDPSARPSAATLAGRLHQAAGDPRGHRYVPPAPSEPTPSPRPATGPAGYVGTAPTHRSSRRWPLLVGVPAAVLLIAVGVTATVTSSSGRAHHRRATTATSPGHGTPQPATATATATATTSASASAGPAPGGSTGWQCGPEKAVGEPPHIVKACIA